MNRPNLPGQLNDLHAMMNQLLVSVPEADAYRSFHPRLAPLAWYLGRSVYSETYWLREVVQGDADITRRSREIFAPAATPASQWQRLPPRDHLLNWALELQEENLTRLSNPRLLGDHPLLQEARLHHIVLQEHARNYERMLMVLTQRQLRLDHNYRVATPLVAALSKADLSEIPQGHYKIGAKGKNASAFDNEQPTQVVQLSGFRIDRTPVSNGAWLAFMQAGGYDDHALWHSKGWNARQQHAKRPDHWRLDQRGHWYGIGLNGPFDLVATDPVMGISRHEAGAYACWLSRQGGELEGAVIQHEYQWEIAARSREIRGYGRVWEWCANLFQPFDGYRQPQLPEARTQEFDDRHYNLRGACLYTQQALKRATFRNRGLPDERHLFSGTRLVFPPE